MGELPLLHVAQTATQVTALDPGVAGAALGAFVIALAFIWRDHLGLLARPRVARAIALRVAAVAVLFAVLPAVLPYDHLFFDEPVATHAEEAAHSMHCHLTPGTCSDAPITAGPGQLIFNDPLIFAAPLLLLALYFTARTLEGRMPKPDLRPPII